MQTTVLEGYRAALAAKVAELSQTLRNRRLIAIENTPEACERISARAARMRSNRGAWTQCHGRGIASSARRALIGGRTLQERSSPTVCHWLHERPASLTGTTPEMDGQISDNIRLSAGPTA